MIRRRPQILAERDDVDAGALQVVERRGDLVFRLAQARASGSTSSARRPRCRFANASTAERLRIARARVAHPAREALDGLEILREHVQTRVDDRRDVGEVAGEVRRQRFDGRLRTARLDRADAVGVMARAAVGAGRRDRRTSARRSLSPMSSTVRAEFSTSSGSSQPRGLPVSTAQNWHARVQTLPISMIVAVPLFQHSPMFGQIDSSHTVASRCSCTVARSCSKRSPVGMRALSHGGFGSRGACWRSARVLHAVLDGGEPLLGLVFRARRDDGDAAKLAHRAW